MQIWHGITLLDRRPLPHNLLLPQLTPVQGGEGSMKALETLSLLTKSQLAVSLQLVQLVQLLLRPAALDPRQGGVSQSEPRLTTGKEHLGTQVEGVGQAGGGGGGQSHRHVRGGQGLCQDFCLETFFSFE